MSERQVLGASRAACHCRPWALAAACVWSAPWTKPPAQQFNRFVMTRQTFRIDSAGGSHLFGVNQNAELQTGFSPILTILAQDALRILAPSFASHLGWRQSDAFVLL